MATTIEDDTFAIMWNTEDGFCFLMPSGLDDEAELPDEAVFLAAIIAKLSDDVFIKEVLEDFGDEELGDVTISTLFFRRMTLSILSNHLCRYVLAIANRCVAARTGIGTAFSATAAV